MRHARWFLYSALWLAAPLAGSVWMLAWSAAPGPAVQAPPDWPAGSALVRSAEGPTLVLSLHPRCSCSSATVAELARLVARFPTLKTFALFIRPAGLPDGWERGRLWDAAALIPGVIAMPDPEGRQTAFFSSETSGHAMLYSPDGRLLFQGGLTAARGHEGDNAGRHAIESLLAGLPSETTATPVFGCDLRGPEAPTNDTTPNQRMVAGQ